MDPSEPHPGRRRERWLVALVVVGALGAIGTWMTWASFSATVTNEGNTVSAGTVRIEDDRSSVPLYDVQGHPVGIPLDRCIAVAYEGSLPADVRLYATTVLAGEHVNLELARGAGPDGSADCVGFVAEDVPIFQGSLAEFAATHTSWDDGLALPALDADGWSEGDTVTYRFRLEQLPTDRPVETGPHAYVWEARSR